MDVRDRGAGFENDWDWDGDGVSKDREGRALFQAGVQTGANFAERKTSGNLAVRYEPFTASSSFSKGIPSTSEMRPVRSPSFNESSRKRPYSLFEGQPRKIWWQWQLYRKTWKVSVTREND